MTGYVALKPKNVVLLADSCPLGGGRDRLLPAWNK
jgi:hypothetical protein